MNSFISFRDAGLFSRAVSAIEMDCTPEYELDEENLRIFSNDIDAIRDILEDNGIFMFEVERGESGPDDSMDGDFDSGMASAGLGTDENYGDFGGDRED